MNTVEQLRAFLRERADLCVQAEDAEAALGLSGTTLRRRLREQGTTWKRELNRERTRRCEERRAQGVPLDRIIEELGFSERVTFHRWHRDYHGEGWRPAPPALTVEWNELAPTVRTLIMSIDSLGIGYRAVAEALGVTRATVWNWCTGRKRPTAENCALIQGYLKELTQ